jgi:hypothetical protein
MMPGRRRLKAFYSRQYGADVQGVWDGVEDLLARSCPDDTGFGARQATCRSVAVEAGEVASGETDKDLPDANVDALALNRREYLCYVRGVYGIAPVSLANS